MAATGTRGKMGLWAAVAGAETVELGLTDLVLDACDDCTGCLGREVEAGSGLTDDDEGELLVTDVGLEGTDGLGTTEELVVKVAVVARHGVEIVAPEHTGEDDSGAPFGDPETAAGGVDDTEVDVGKDDFGA